MPVCHGTGQQTIVANGPVMTMMGPGVMTIQRVMPCTYCSTPEQWASYQDTRRWGAGGGT